MDYGLWISRDDPSIANILVLDFYPDLAL